jgi:sterol desaturase/sphingolipid hydroxylase (fatty acid hydroxylase superfamily)
MKTFERPLSSGTERLFNNSFLERLTRSHISVPITLFIVYACCLMALNIANSWTSMRASIALFFLGWLVFSWVEYNVHRFLFHIDIRTAARAKFQYTMHGVHHHHPKDKDRLAMPPLLSIGISTLLLFILQLFIGHYVFAFLPGFLVGYAFYLLIHYLVHIHQPPKNIFRQLWINHAIHHYKDGEIVFGVSSPLWDYVYGTMCKRQDKRQEKHTT